MAARRYSSATARNTQNLLDRFHGVNKGNASTRKGYLDKFSLAKPFDLRTLKIHVGVRELDSAFDNTLNKIVEEVNASTKKVEKAVKVEKAQTTVNEVKESLSDVPLKFVLPKAEKPTNKHKKSKHRPDQEH